MAIFVNSRKWVSASEAHRLGGEIIDYFVDTPADIPNLPDTTKIIETSTAFVVSTSEVYTLMSSGWVRL